MHLLNKFILVYILLLLLSPIGHIPHSGFKTAHTSYILARNSILSTQNISQNTTIGSNLTRSDYRISGNLNIKRNYTLTIINTVVLFTFPSENYSCLSDNGTLILYNSEITMSQTSSLKNSLSIIVKGTPKSQSRMVMNNSSILINGTLNAENSMFYAKDSVISSMGAGSNAGTEFQNSTVLFYNSTLAGEKRQTPTSEFKSGDLYGPDSWFSNIGDVPLHGTLTSSGKTLVNRIDISLTYGGYTYGNASYMLFNVSGATVYRYTLESTGYPFNETTVNFSVNLSGSLPDSDSLINGGDFTSFFTLVPYKTNTTLFNISVSLLSNDTISLFGKQFFGPLMINSTTYAVKSGFKLDYDRGYLIGNELNPAKNAFFLENGSTLFSVGSYAFDTGTSTSSSPFEISGSSATIYSLQTMNDISMEGRLNGTTNTVTADGLNSKMNIYVNQENQAILSALSGFGLEYSNVSHNGVATIPLLQDVINQTSSNYIGNYIDTVDAQESYFSENASTIFLQNSTPVNVRVNVPELFGILEYHNATYGSTLNITSSVSSFYSPSRNVTLYVNATNGDQSENLEEFKENLSSNQTELFTRKINTTSLLNPGEYLLTLSFSGVRYVYNSQNTLSSHNLMVYSNVDLSMSYNYSMSNANSVVLNVTILNSGIQPANESVFKVSFYDGTALIGENSKKINVGPEENISVMVNFASKYPMTNATMTIITSSTVDPYNTSGQVDQASFNWSAPITSQYYYVTVQRYGIPQNTIWSIISNNTVYQTIEPYLVIKVHSGYNSLKIDNISGYHPEKDILSINVSSNLTVNVTYLETYYSVVFRFTGTIPASGVAIQLDNHTYVTRNITFSSMAPDGVYRYSVTTASGYALKKSNGTFSVDNRNITITVQISKIVKPGGKDVLYIYTRDVFIPAAVTASVLGFLLYRSASRSVYICPKCGSTLNSRFGDCACPESEKRGKRRKKG